MPTEMGEYLVGAYLKLLKGCHFVDYNVRPPGGGLAGLDEFDVVGFDFKNSRAYLCEVTTHVAGLLYGSGNKDTVDRIRKKFEKQQAYAETHLSRFRPEFMFWSPVVPKGRLTDELDTLARQGLTVVINGKFKESVAELIDKARREKNDTGNPAFRMLQILGSLRD